MSRKKIKVAPLSAPSDLDLDAEERKEKEQTARMKSAANYMNEKHMKEIMLPFKLTSGRLRFGCCLPRAFRETVQLSMAGEISLSGTPAAAIRLIKLKPHEIRRIRKVSHKMDSNHHNFVSIPEFVHFLKCEDTIFIRKILQHCITTGADIDTNGRLELSEFFLAVIVLCTYTHDQILRAVFIAFDADKSGYLDKAEMDALAKDVRSVSGGANFASANISELIKSLDKDGDGVISEQEFYQLEKFFPAVFHPVFRLQDRLRKATLGVTRWRRLVEAFDKQERSRAAMLAGYEGDDRVSLADYLAKMDNWKAAKLKAAKGKKAADAHNLKVRAAAAGGLAKLKAAGLAVTGTGSSMKKVNDLEGKSSVTGAKKLPPLKKK